MNAPGPAQEVVKLPCTRKYPAGASTAPAPSSKSAARGTASGARIPARKQVKRKLGAKRKPGGRDGLTRKQAEAQLRELMGEVHHAAA